MSQSSGTGRADGKRRGRGGPRPPTERRIYNQATWYLKRYFAPRAHVRRLLVRKQDRALAVHGGDRDEVLGWVDAVLDRLVSEGALDDRRYAIDKARALVRRGNPTRMVQLKLRQKGVPAPLIDEALDVVRAESGDPDARAAAAYVRKRRLGPYRAPPERRERFDKDLARMGRAGFPYGLARSLLELPDPDAVEQAEFSGSL